MASHEHQYEFTGDAEVLAAAAKKLDWPSDAPERISGVQRCRVCGDLNRLSWTGPEYGGIPRWMIDRIRRHKAPRAHREG